LGVAEFARAALVHLNSPFDEGPRDPSSEQFHIRSLMGLKMTAL